MPNDNIKRVSRKGCDKLAPAIPYESITHEGYAAVCIAQILG